MSAGCFSSIRSQEFPLQYLRNAWNNERMPHAFLFAGTPGVGKTMTARALAMMKFCAQPDTPQFEPCMQCSDCRSIIAGEHPDMVQMLHDPDEAFIKIGKPQDLPPSDPVRLNYPVLMVELLYTMQRTPSRGKGRFVLIQNAEKMNATSGNALLKAIEEPAPGSMFILTTTNLEGIISTIRSRCHIIRFNDIPAADIAELLQEDPGCSPEEAQTASRFAGGSITQAREMIARNVLPVRHWIAEIMGAIPGWDPFSLSAMLRKKAPGMVFGFDENGDPISPPGSGRTQHPQRQGLQKLFEMMLEYLRDCSLIKQELRAPVWYYDTAMQLQPDQLPSADAIDAAQEELVHAGQAVSRNVAMEMVVDNLLQRIHQLFTGATV